MSATQSNLTPTGFDYVVAVTQDSINGTLKNYLDSGLPEVILCYWYDPSTPNTITPTPVDYQKLVQLAKNTDPFAVPDNAPSTDPRVQNLNDAGFAFAVKAKLGIPPGVANLPPIVGLKPGQSNVLYTMTFSEFIATEIIFGPRGSVTWFNQAQPAGTVWEFTGAVDLNFQNTAFTNLPPATQQALKDAGDPNEFSVQQLYYDLNSTDLEQGFTFSGAPLNSALSVFMTGDFINTYWKALGGQEVLGYGATQKTTVAPTAFAVTDLNFFTPDAIGTTGAPLTLNYLCALNGNHLPDTTHAGFGWNWVEPSEVAQFDGAAALNRTTLARYYDKHLRDYVARNCYSPAGHVRVWLSGFLDTTVNYQWGLTNGQTPTMSIPATGATVLTYSYNSGEAEDDAGAGGDMGKLSMSSSFNLSVAFQGTTIVITQHLVVYVYIRSLQTGAGGNVVDVQLTDTYSLGVDGQGKITVSTPSATANPQTSVKVDTSQTPGTNGFLNFFTDLNSLTSDVASWTRGFAETNLADVPVSAVQNFVFPGGATFSFNDVQFSDNQDLVSHITYGKRR